MTIYKLFSSVNDIGEKFIAGVSHGEITKSLKFFAGVNNTAEKLFTGINDIADKFFGGVNDTGN
jgi:hypothetical protein